MTKLLCSLWLLLSCLFLQAETAVPVPGSFVPAWQSETASGRTIDYGVQNGRAKSKCDYDAALMLSTGERKLRSLAIRPLIGDFVKFVAAKALPTPKVTDPKLGNIVNDLYKGAKGKNPIGTGSTADAVRNELTTGLATQGKFHSQKAQEYINALNNWQRRNQNASDYDRLVAESLKRDLQSALGGN